MIWMTRSRARRFCDVSSNFIEVSGQPFSAVCGYRWCPFDSPAVVLAPGAVPRANDKSAMTNEKWETGHLLRSGPVGLRATRRLAANCRCWVARAEKSESII